MKEIAALELRKDLASVIKSLRQGVSLILTYRGTAIGRLEPMKPSKKSGAKDPLRSIGERAIESPLGALDHNSIDRNLYE